MRGGDRMGKMEEKIDSAEELMNKPGVGAKTEDKVKSTNYKELNDRQTSWSKYF